MYILWRKQSLGIFLPFIRQHIDQIHPHAPAGIHAQKENNFELKYEINHWNHLRFRFTFKKVKVAQCTFLELTVSVHNVMIVINYSTK